MPTYVFAGASARTGGVNSGVFRRSIDGDHWEHLTNGLSADTHAHAITVHPDEAAVVYAATSTGLYRSLNHGGRWERVVVPAEGEQMWSVMIHPAESSRDPDRHRATRAVSQRRWWRHLAPHASAGDRRAHGRCLSVAYHAPRRRAGSAR